MGALSRRLDRFCYNHPNFGIPNLMKFIVMGNVLVFMLDSFSGSSFSLIVGFLPEMIYQGQIWRLITFVFVPASDNIILFLITTLFYYWIGNALEQRWGHTRFTVYYLLGTILTVIVGLVGNYWVTMYYVNMSMFFAIATLYPDMKVYLYFILPIKIKWLAYLNVAFFAYDIFYYISIGAVIYALVPVFALLNYFIFFWSDLRSAAQQTQRRARHRTSPQTVNFKQAQKEIKQRKGYLHKCTVCGLTDEQDPDMDFRYCSKCSGYHCYCSEHLRSHDHIQ